MEYSKHFVPLESDPQVFTELAQRLGVSDRFKFIDIPSLDNEVGTSPVPILALILNFPPCPAYEKEVKEQTPIDCDNNEIVWLKQTIGNACGLYALLHSVCNVTGAIIPGSILDKLMKAPNRAEYVQDSKSIAEVYNEAAQGGCTEAPPAEIEVDNHFICIVEKSRQLFLLDGDMHGPIRRGWLAGDEDIWTGKGFAIIREYMESTKDAFFSLLALVDLREMGDNSQIWKWLQGR